MPNWTNNVVCVRRATGGSKASEQLEDFYKRTCKIKASDEDEPDHVDFNGVLPVPNSETNSSHSYELNVEAALEKIRFELSNAPQLGLNEEERVSREVIEEVYSKSIEIGMTDSPRHWCIAFWGTKWNACYSTWNREGNEIKLTFDTAWNTPHGWAEAIVRQYPNLSFHFLWNNEGEGNYVDEEGEVVNEETHGEDYYDAPGVEWVPIDYVSSTRWDYDVQFMGESLIEANQEPFTSNDFALAEGWAIFLSRLTGQEEGLPKKKQEE